MSSFLAPLAIVLPLAAATLLAAIGRRLPRTAIDALACIAAATTLGLCIALTGEVIAAGRPLVYWMGDWAPRGEQVVGIGLVIDPLGGLTAAFSALLVTAALLYSWRYFDSVRALYHALMLVFLGAMVGFSLTGDLFNLFVFFELMSVSAYSLTGYKIEDRSSLEGALNFAIVNTVGAYLLLVGVGLLYARTGALNLAQLGQTLAAKPADGLVAVGAALICSGFFIKGSIVPFHFWLPDAHAVAPTPVCVLFSGIMVELGLFGAARLYWMGLSGALAKYAGGVSLTLITAGVVTALLGAVMAWLQRHVKRLLAFSTISHAGMMLIGFGLLSAEGLAAMFIYLVGHGLVKGALFMLAGVVLNRLDSIDELDLAGRGRSLPWIGVMFLLGGLGLAGFPPFGTWLGKTALDHAAGGAGWGWLKWIWLAAEVITGAAVLRAAGRIFLGWGSQENDGSDSPSEAEHPESSQPRRTPWVTASIAASLLLLGAVMAAGSQAYPVLLGAARGWIDQPRYAAVVFGRSAVDSTQLPGIAPLTWASAASGWAASAAAVLIAALALSPAWQAWQKRPAPAMLGRTLQRLHSGYVGDYIAWLMAGVALLGAAFLGALR